MSNLVERLFNDVRVKEGLHACIDCGTCTAICPAASFYDYEPRELVQLVQRKDEKILHSLLTSDYIWYCGECMSCKTRCPKDNVPGLLVEALRALSQDTGLFIESEKGRQQLAIKRTVGDWIVQEGYCIVSDYLNIEMFPEQGPNWEWVLDNAEEVFEKQGANYMKEGNGAMRKIPQEDLDELQKIYDVTGCTERFRLIENLSKKQAEKMNMQFDETMDCEYARHVYEFNSKYK